jgi:hypothetical protein
MPPARAVTVSFFVGDMEELRMPGGRRFGQGEKGSEWAED